MRPQPVAEEAVRQATRYLNQKAEKFQEEKRGRLMVVAFSTILAFVLLIGLATYRALVGG